MDKLISVIIPVKDGEKYLEEAISNIKKQAVNLEIIVVNDASTDKTALIAKEQGCILMDHDVCKGQVAAKNTGLKAASGEYILFHDSDDVMRDGVLSLMYEELEKDPATDAVMAMVKDFISPELSSEEAKGFLIKEEPYYGLFSGAVLCRKKVFDAIGPFDEGIHTGEILSWKMGLDRNHMKMKKLDFVSTDRRIHKSNFGRTDRKREFQDYASVLKAKLRRK